MHFQFRKKLNLYFLFVLFINLSRFSKTKVPYCGKNNDIEHITLFYKILLFPRFYMNKTFIIVTRDQSAFRNKN